jgi:hypothetical protein
VEPQELDERAWPRFAVAPGTITVGTVSYFPPSPLVVELWSKAPPLELEDWDHVAEASLELPTGEVQIGFDSYSTLALAPGSYRVRVLGSGLERGDSEASGHDRYGLQLWPAPVAAPALLKRWRELPAEDPD